MLHNFHWFYFAICYIQTLCLYPQSEDSIRLLTALMTRIGLRKLPVLERKIIKRQYPLCLYIMQYGSVRAKNLAHVGWVEAMRYPTFGG
jgi:hypothetical protein